MRKSILSLVILFGVFFSLTQVFANSASDTCFIERTAMVTAGYVGYLPDPLMTPPKYSPPTNTDCTEGSIMSKNKIVCPEVEAAYQKEYQLKLSDYNSIIATAKQKLSSALATKLTECTNLEKGSNAAPTLSPAPQISSVPTSCDTTNDQTISSLKAQIGQLQITNASLSLQISSLKTELVSEQKQNLTSKNSLEIKSKESTTTEIVPLVPTTQNELTPITEEIQTPVKKGFWQTIKEWFR